MRRDYKYRNLFVSEIVGERFGTMALWYEIWLFKQEYLKNIDIEFPTVTGMYIFKDDGSLIYNEIVELVELRNLIFLYIAFREEDYELVDFLRGECHINENFIKEARELAQNAAFR